MLVGHCPEQQGWGGLEPSKQVSPEAMQTVVVVGPVVVVGAVVVVVVVVVVVGAELHTPFRQLSPADESHHPL